MYILGYWLTRTHRLKNLLRQCLGERIRIYTYKYTHTHTYIYIYKHISISIYIFIDTRLHAPTEELAALAPQQESRACGDSAAKGSTPIRDGAHIYIYISIYLYILIYIYM